MNIKIQIQIPVIKASHDWEKFIYGYSFVCK